MRNVPKNCRSPELQSLSDLHWQLEVCGRATVLAVVCKLAAQQFTNKRCRELANRVTTTSNGKAIIKSRQRDREVREHSPTTAVSTLLIMASKSFKLGKPASCVKSHKMCRNKPPLLRPVRATKAAYAERGGRGRRGLGGECGSEAASLCERRLKSTEIVRKCWRRGDFAERGGPSNWINYF